ASYVAYILLQMAYPELIKDEHETWESHHAYLERHHTGRRSDAGLEYRVVHRVLNAANFGVPQRRERVVFVGFRSDLNVEWSFPQDTHSLDSLLWNQLHGDYWDRHGIARADRT